MTFFVLFWSSKKEHKICRDVNLKKKKQKDGLCVKYWYYSFPHMIQGKRCYRGFYNLVNRDIFFLRNRSQDTTEVETHRTHAIHFYFFVLGILANVFIKELVETIFNKGYKIGVLYVLENIFTE